jgi:hypothetical protein
MDIRLGEEPVAMGDVDEPGQFPRVVLVEMDAVGPGLRQEERGLIVEERRPDLVEPKFPSYFRSLCKNSRAGGRNELDEGGGAEQIAASHVGFFRFRLDALFGAGVVDWSRSGQRRCRRYHCARAPS